MNPIGDTANPLPPEDSPSTQDEVAPEYANDPLRVLGSQFYTLTPGEPGGTVPNAPVAPTAEIPWPRIPGYEILRELGRGGMGVVYQAKHLSLKRIVALKMILGGNVAGEEMLHRFRQEAQIIAELDHPNIVQVYDCGEWEGKAYISLEFISGPSLKDLLRGDPLPPRACAELMAVLADTMAAVHARQVVHRDLKPANILLKRKSQNTKTKSQTNPNEQISKPTANPKQGSDFPPSDLGFVGDLSFEICDFIPKVTDFGIAKKLDVEEGQTRTGVVLGSPHYMAPEQVEGRIRDIGPPTDVFALGGMLYEMLSGQPPFTAESLYALMGKITKEDPAPLRKRLPSVPKGLEFICLKCLRKRPDERYPSAAELAADLDKFLTDEVGTTPSILAKADHRRGRQQPNYLLYALAVLVVLTVAALAFVFWNPLGSGARDTAVAQGSGASSTGASTGHPQSSPTKGTGSAIGPTATEPPGRGPPPEEELAKRLARLKADLEADAAVNDEAAFLQRAKALVDFKDEVLDAELLAYKAEYLLEAEQQLDKAQACLNRVQAKPRLLPYVQARLLHRQGKAEAAATAMADAPAETLVGFRRRKALNVYEEAARPASNQLHMDVAALGQTPSDHGGPIWATAARALGVAQPMAEMSTDLLLLLVWHSATPQKEHLNLLLDHRAAELTRRKDGMVLMAELHRRRAELRKTAEPSAAVKDFFQAFQGVKDLKEEVLPATTKCAKLLEPALTWADAGNRPFDDTAHGQLAELYAAKGAMMFKDPFPTQGSWPKGGDDPYREASDAYGKALAHLPLPHDAVRKAHYLTQKGLCLAKLGQSQLMLTEIRDILRDADEATQLNPKLAEAFALRGTALYLQASIDQTARHTRDVEDRLQRVQKGLQDAEAAFKEAFALSKDQGSRELLSTWHANRCATYVFWAGMLQEEGRVFADRKATKTAQARQKYLAALKDGRQAVDFNLENENAFGVLGIAHLLYAFSLEPGEKEFDEQMQQAETALKRQVELRPTRELGLVTLGLFHAQRGSLAKRSGKRELMENYHRQARQYLEQVTKRNPNHPDANCWLGFLAAQEEKYDVAAQCLGKFFQDQKFLRSHLESRLAGSFSEQDVEKILVASAGTEATLRPADRAAWLVLRALHRLRQLEPMLQAKLARKEPPEAKLLGPLKDCMAYLEQVENLKLDSPTLHNLARDLGASTRLLAARLPDVPKAERLRFLLEADVLLKGVHRELAPSLDQAWALLATTAFSLFLDGGLSRAQGQKLLDLAEGAAKEAVNLTTDDRVKKRMSKLREDTRAARNAPQ